MLGSTTLVLVMPCSKIEINKVYMFSSICGKLGTAGKWPKRGMHSFVESYKKILERDMALETMLLQKGI